MAKKDDRSVNEIIINAAKETAKEVILELKNSRMIKNDISYFRKVELLLYNYENLKEAVKQKDEDIDYIKRHGLPEKSKSIVMYGTGGGTSGQDRYLQLIEKYKTEKDETEREILKIENALNKIRGDKYFKILEFKYLNTANERMSDEKISEIFDKDQSTISRNRKRLINSIKVILFPQSIKEFA